MHADDLALDKIYRHIYIQNIYTDDGVLQAEKAHSTHRMIYFILIYFHLSLQKRRKDTVYIQYVMFPKYNIYILYIYIINNNNMVILYFLGKISRNKSEKPLQ